MKLRRIEKGRYVTPDGRFAVVNGMVGETLCECLIQPCRHARNNHRRPIFAWVIVDDGGDTFFGKEYDTLADARNELDWFYRNERGTA